MSPDAPPQSRFGTAPREISAASAEPRSFPSFRPDPPSGGLPRAMAAASPRHYPVFRAPRQPAPVRTGAIMKLDDSTRMQLEAAAFRRLLDHLRTRTDVQNIDLMNLAGF